MSDHSKRVICSIAGIVVLEIVAMLTGHNGTLLRLSLVAIAGLGGFSLAKFLLYRQSLPPPPPPPPE
jgi:hypothetical protein